MSITLAVAPERDALTVEVSEPTGQESVTLKNVAPSATVSQILGMAATALRLPPNVVWDLRDEVSSRLLPPNQTLSEIAGETAPHVRATLQPDAGLA